MDLFASLLSVVLRQGSDKVRTDHQATNNNGPSLQHNKNNNNLMNETIVLSLETNDGDDLLLCRTC